MSQETFGPFDFSPTPTDSMKRKRLARHVSIVILTVVVLAAGWWLRGQIDSFSEIGLEDYTSTIDRISLYSHWEDTSAAKRFLRRLGFTERHIAEVIEDKPGDVSEGKALMDAGFQQKEHLEDLVKSRGNARLTLYAFCGLQLFFGYLAILYSILTGRTCGHERSDSDLPGWKQFVRNMHGHVASHSSSLITILGICGTFFGLTLGLSGMSNSPAGRIDLQPLFISLSISFLSSLCGIITSIITRFIQQAFTGKPTEMRTLTGAIEQLQKSNERHLKGNTDAINAFLSMRDEIIDDMKVVLEKAVGEMHDEHRQRIEEYSESIAGYSSLLVDYAEQAKEELRSVDEIRESHLSMMQGIERYSAFSSDYLKHMAKTSTMLQSSRQPIEKITKELLRFNGALDRSIKANEHFADTFLRRVKHLDARYGATSYVMVQLQTKEEVKRFERLLKETTGAE